MHSEWLAFKAYLDEMGEPFHPEWMGGHDQMIVDDAARFKSVASLFKNSAVLPYYLIAQGLSGWLGPAWQCVREMAGPCRVLDYRCGIGTTGLHLAALGYEADFAEQPGRCADYVKWRLLQREMEERFHTLTKKGDLPAKAEGRYPLAVSLGTLGWLPPREQQAHLDALAGLGEVVVVDGVAKQPPAGGPWHAVDVDAITEAVAAQHALLRHAVYDVVHHVWVYRTEMMGEVSDKDADVEIDDQQMETDEPAARALQAEATDSGIEEV